MDGAKGHREHKPGLVKALDGRSCTATEAKNDGVLELHVNACMYECMLYVCLLYM